MDSMQSGQGAGAGRRLPLGEYAAADESAPATDTAPLISRSPDTFFQHTEAVLLPMCWIFYAIR